MTLTAAIVLCMAVTASLAFGRGGSPLDSRGWRPS